MHLSEKPPIRELRRRRNATGTDLQCRASPKAFCLFCRARNAGLPPRFAILLLPARSLVGVDGSRFRNPDRHHPGAPVCRRPDPDWQSRARSRAGEDCQGGIDGACNFDMATFSVHAARARRGGSALSSAARAFHVRPNRPERISARKAMVAWPPSLLRRMPEPSKPFVTVLLFTASSTPLPIGRLGSIRGPIAHA